MLPVKLSYSIKNLKKNTNDSVYIPSTFSYRLPDSSWTTMDIQLRKRGNYRLKNCYFPPIKVKFKKSIVKNTHFEGHKSMKVVLPCLQQKDKNDNVIKEYLAYKVFEIVSPYYFKTRMLDISFEEIRNNKTKMHQVKGFLVEDDKHVAKRMDGKVYGRAVHPLQQEEVASVRNAFFQCMIGNTDFSQAQQHNVKLMFFDKSIIPVPYDFDMSGFVNCSYAVVSQIKDQKLPLSSVRDRMYRGFKRNPAVFQQVRQEFLDAKVQIFAALDECESLFDDPREFEVARDYIASFYDILVNDKKFKNNILDMARSN
ncbi:MAG: hypothetical protein KJO77_11480 [Bacteroidia bacterium]|nr:hypothetical protein [Bacteroidia bacterium]